MYGDGTVYLIDMAGEVVHRWQMPYRPGLYAHFLDNGHLFYGGKVMEDLDRFAAWPRFKAGGGPGRGLQGPRGWGIRPSRPPHPAGQTRPRHLAPPPPAPL